MEIEAGLTVPVATRGHLMALKVLAADDATRPNDRADLLALLARAGADEIRVARTTLDLIAQRGFARGKDLQAELDAILRVAGRNP